ncbi:retrovirus-related pol polyprotein from transposon TNT 1-94 [Tanacetum coccineum]
MKSGLKTLNTARQNSLRAAVNTARPINIAYPRPTVNCARPASNVFNRAHSHVRRPFNKFTTNKNSNFNERVNTVRGNVTTVGPKAVLSDNKGNEANAVKALACWVWRQKQKVLDHVSRHNGASMNFKRFDYGNPQLELQEKGVIDSRCSRHILETCPIFLIMKKLMVGMLPLEEIPKEELKFNLFSVSQMCDKKNNVLFTDTECVVLSSDFKLLDESKFDGKAEEGFFVGYSVNSKAFRVFNSRTRIVDENLHITFLKNKPNVVESRPEWLFDIDTLTKYMNYKPVIAGNQSNGSAGTKACDNACKAIVETVPSKDYILLPFLTQDLLFSSSLKDSPDAGFKPSGEEEKKDAEALENKDSEVLNTEESRVNQEKDENVNSTNNINTVSLTVDTASIEDNAIDENIVYGCADDLNMPNLEEIDYSNDDEGVDAEADMNNLDTFMPCNRGSTTKIFIIICLLVFYHKQNPRSKFRHWWIYHMARGPWEQNGSTETRKMREPMPHSKMDVKSAFLYSKIEEEVYVCQPPEFEDLEFPDRVYKVEKALCGLHQAPRAWNYNDTGKDDGLFMQSRQYEDEILNKTMLVWQLDKKSTIGGCQFLGRRLISWQCKKQTVVANSTTKAEYVAASNCCGHVLWIQNQLLVYRYNFMNTKIFIDKESTICIVKNLVFHSKTKHIEIRHHFIRDSNEKKLIQMIKIDTDLNITDLLTKAFDVSRFQYLIASIGMLNL